MISALVFIVQTVSSFLFWVIIINVVLSWLIAFNIINQYNQVVRTIHSFCYRVTEPLLAPIRRFLPDLGGIDISPMILLVAVVAAEVMIVSVLRTGQVFS